MYGYARITSRRIPNPSSFALYPLVEYDSFMLSFEQSLHPCTYDAPGFAGGARWLSASGFPRVGGILFLL